MWSDVSGNTSGGNGGGAYNSGVLSFTASLISGNTALIGVTRAGTPTQGGGGGIFNSATLTITDSTVANNLSSFGGGVFNSEGKVTITSATIANNTAQAGGKGTLVKDAQAGGLESISSGAIGFANLRNTLIVGNVTIDPRILPANCGTSPQQTIQSLGHNFDSAGQCGFLDVSDMSDRDPLIGPLANNGGKTRSVALMPNSPAIDAGDNNVCGMYDQRGLSGPSGPGGILQRQVTGIGSGPAVCDIGAFEYHPAIFLPLVRR
jgi:hypothetical protein